MWSRTDCAWPGLDGGRHNLGQRVSGDRYAEDSEDNRDLVSIIQLYDRTHKNDVGSLIRM